MQTIKEQTVYTEVPISERLPEEYGWYSTLYLANLQDFFWFESGNFYNPEDRETPINVTHWLEKKENQVVMSLEDFKRVIGETFNAGYNHGFGQSEFEGESVTPNKEQYLSNLFKK